MKIKRAHLQWLLVLLSVMLVLASERVSGMHWLSMLWMLPLALALDGASKKQAVILSAVCAFMVWMLSISWVLEPLITGYHSTVLMAVVIYTFLCLWQIIPYAALGFCYAHFQWGRHTAGPFLAAAILTVVWSYWPTLIPGLPQHTLYRYPELIAIIDISGTSGLLFVSTLWCFAMGYCGVRSNPYKKAYAVLVLFIPCLMLAYGALREHQYQAELQNAGKEQWLKVAYIQPSLIRPAPADRIYQMSEKVINEQSPDLLVWPEPSIVYSLIDIEDDRKNTTALSTKYKQDMLVNSGYVYTNDDEIGEYRTYYNRAHLLRNGSITGEYSKQVLVPFAEYMPEALGFLRAWMPGVSYFRAAKDQKPITYNDNIKLAVVLCYEAIFPSLVRELIKDGGNLLVNPVSDTQFGSGWGGHYHFALAFFRSIENRVPYVRAANTGVSVIVGANGKVISPPTSLHAVTSGQADIFIPEKRSLYSGIGDWFSVLSGFSVLLYCLVFYYKNSFKLQGNEKSKEIIRKGEIATEKPKNKSGKKSKKRKKKK